MHVVHARRLRTSRDRRAQARAPPSPRRPRRRPGTVQESVRSRSASAGCLVSVSTERSGFVSVGSGFIAARTTTRLAGGHAALEAARAVGLAHVAALVVPEDLVVRLRADATRQLEAVADRHALHRVDRHERPARGGASRRSSQDDVRAEAGQQRRRRAPRRRRRGSRSPSARGRSRRPSPRSRPRSRQRTGEASTSAKSSGCERRRARAPSPSRSGARGCGRVTPSSRRNAFASAPAATRAAVSRALARSSTLRTSVWPNFEDAGEVGVAGTRKVDLLDLLLDRPGVHPLLPVGVVAVLDQERDRAAERAAVPDAAAHDRAVGLDLHPAAAAVAELAAGEVAVDVVGGRARGPRAGLRARPRGRGRATRRRS